MPNEGLDNSWALAMNAAISNNLIIGKDILFTFGPYASIVTKLYSPETDSLMLFGASILGAGYSLSLLVLIKNVSFIWSLLLYVVMAGIVYFIDPIFITFPLLLAIIFYRLTLPDTDCFSLNFTKKQEISFSLLFIPLGLLCLIKGSYLIICVSIVILSSVYLKYKNKITLSILLIVVPILSAIIMWIVAGQPIMAIIYYALNLLPIISGYTDAMSINGNMYEIVLYLISSSIILYMLITVKKRSESSKYYLLVVYALVLFIMFKGGFVRHDGHAIMAVTGLVVVTITLKYVMKHVLFPYALLMSFITWGVTDKNYYNTSTEAVFNNMYKVIHDARKGFKLRINDPEYFENLYKENFNEIKSTYKIPELQGSSNIYSYSQAYLLASKNDWNPRPVFQSYSVYSPYLAENNRDHLLKANSPDNIVFNIEPIDNRLPSLEDGVSWPVLIRNYKPFMMDEKFLYLKKNTVKPNEVKEVNTYEKKMKLGEVFYMPDTTDVLFSKIIVKPTFFGLFKGLVYKREQLEIEIEMRNENIKKYRYIPSMGESGFIISPLIESTKEFSLLFSNEDILQDKNVRSIKINVLEGFGSSWSDDLTIVLSRLEKSTGYNVNDWMDFDDFVSISSLHVNEFKVGKCSGNFEKINDIPVSKSRVTIKSNLHVEGWLVESINDAVLANVIYITLTDKQGNKKFINTNLQIRKDVGLYFNEKGLSDSGYNAFFSIGDVVGEYTLGVSKYYEGTMTHCENFQALVLFSDS